MLPVNIACAFENITFVKKVRKKSPEVLIQNLYDALNVIWYHFHSFLWLCIHICLDHYWKYIHFHVNSTSTIPWQVKNMFCNRKKIKYLIATTLTTLLPWEKSLFQCFLSEKVQCFHKIRICYRNFSDRNFIRVLRQVLLPKISKEINFVINQHKHNATGC